MASVPISIRSRRIQRFLFVGPTGAGEFFDNLFIDNLRNTFIIVGKSKIINCCYNRRIDHRSLSSPAEVGAPERLIGQTSSISNYVDQHEKKVYVDTVGYGDARFQMNKDSFILFFRELICYASMGYNWLFLVLRYERLTLDVLDYVEMLEELLGERALTRCTIVFTHCKIKNMNREACIAANKESEKIVRLLEQVQSIIFGDMDTYEDSELTRQERAVLSRVQANRRQRFMEQLLRQIDSTDEDVLRLNESWFHSQWGRFSQFVGYCVEKVFGKSSELSKRYRLATTLKKEIPVTIYYESCPICRDLIYEIWNTEPTTSITRCGHIFHYACLKKYFDQRKTCPICRSDLRSFPERILSSRIGLHPIDDAPEIKARPPPKVTRATEAIIPSEASTNAPITTSPTVNHRPATPLGAAVGELISIEESIKF